MCFFRKKGYKKMLESHEEVVDNPRNLEATLAYVNDKETVRKEIEEVLRLLKYEVGPSKDKDANKIDHKIANKIGDLKIVLTRDKDDSETKALEILNLIKIDVAERKVYSK